MQISKKQLFGLGGLAIVVGMTFFAYNLPTNATSISGDVDVVVRVYNDKFETKIESPLDGEEFTNKNVTFKEIHSHADNVKYYLYHLDENGNIDATYELTDWEVDGSDLSGVTEFTLNLDNYGGFGTYIFKSVITSPGGQTGEDAVKFSYVSATTPDDDVKVDPETGEVDVEVCYAAGTKVLTIDIYDTKGNLVARLEDYIVKNPETGGCETITIKVGDINIESGDYELVINTYDNYDKTGEPTGQIVISFKYEAPDAPNVPDTGSLLGALNISKGDFLVTGLIGFTVISIIALAIIKRNNRRN